MDKSRFPNFYELPIEDRIEAVFERGLISEEDYKNKLEEYYTTKRDFQ